ncbi:MAG: hypothetical protein ACPGVN_05280 [Alphaproteobacteria bacterium]
MVDKTTIRILSLDGGNLLNAGVPLFVLSEIEQRLSKPIHSLFDVIAGVGSSSFCAAGLTIPDEGGDLNNATDLATFYMHQAKNFTNKTGFGKSNFANLMKSFFKESLLSEAKVELLLPMMDLQRSELVEVASWNARANTADGTPKPRDFVVADLVTKATTGTTQKNLKPLTAKDGSKHLFATGEEALSNPTQVLHSAVRQLCGDATKVEVVSIGNGYPDEQTSLANLKTMRTEVFGQHMQSAVANVIAKQVHKDMARDKTVAMYRRFDHQVEVGAGHKQTMQSLIKTRDDVAVAMKQLDLGFLT